MRYADPSLCPDCRSDLPRGVATCPTCRLLVRHPLAVRLFGTLHAADSLLGELRTLSDRATAGPPTSPAAPAAAPAPPLPPRPPVPVPLPSYPSTAHPAPARTGVGFASVPKILLGLGALCLLVAAVVFLAVSWSSLGVGGRTAVLAGFTVTACASALLLHRAGLRIAGEALVVVALGMLGLDVLGAGAAGWLGAGPGGLVVLTAGIVVGLAGATLGTVVVAGRPRLVAPQIASGIGLLLAWAGAMDATEHRLLAGHALTALAVVGVLLARRVPAPAMTWSVLAAGIVPWTATAVIAFGQAVLDPDLRQLWLEGSGWSLLGTAAVLVLPGLVLRDQRTLLVGASGAAMALTVVATLPCIDTDTSTVGLVALVVTAAWVLALALLPRTLRVVAIAPAACGSVVLTGLALATASLVLARWAEVGAPFGRGADVALRTPDPVTEPVLLVPSLLVVLAFLGLLTPDRTRSALVSWLQAGSLVAGVGAAVTVASYDAWLAAPVAVLALVALVASVFALTSTGGRATGFGLSALVVAAAGCVAAVPSSTLTAGAALVAFAIAIGLLMLAGGSARVLGGAAAAPYLALLVAATVDAVGAGPEWVAVPVLLAVGVLALGFPREELELAAVASAVATFPVSLSGVADTGSFTAAWLTVAGCLACGTALLHESRRPVAWAGSALLFLATWVRLADLGVRQPEAYTLPLATALVGLGLWRMRRDAGVGTAEALLPGLLLGTVPSLLWVLEDPVSLRALLLGGACLALTILGATLRWSTPLLTGATVGAVVVLREIGAYPGEIPKWVWIALAGMLLIVVGITWERRLLEVRKAVGYLGRLR